MKRLLLLLLSSLCYTLLLAQAPTQTVRGQLIDAETQQPLAVANVQLLPLDRGTVSDSLGRFTLKNIPAGRYQLQATYVGYEPLLLPEVLVESGKEQVLQLELQQSAKDLEAIEVTASRSDIRLLHPIGIKAITIDQVRRFPASYYDPARLAAAQAGVLTANDQSNGISIRGHSPDQMAWQLEGVQILNPNHTPNAGTFTDRVTLNSGGINILSAQMLGTSHLYTGAAPSGISNALAGVMDMRLRPGNNEDYEFTAQLGLIGLDATAEGPFSRSGRSSFLVNYRYSTVGLLTQLGVDFGEEAIDYQDLSFNLVFPGKKGGRLSLFGIGGISSNQFASPEDPSDWESDRDLFDVDFESAMGAAGISWTRPSGERGLWSVTGAISAVDQERTSSPQIAELDSLFTRSFLEDDDRLRLLSGHGFYRYRFNPRFSLQAGLQIRQFNHLEERLIGRNEDPERTETLTTPYLRFSGTLGQRTAFQAGVQLSAYANAEAAYLEPRFSLSHQLARQHEVSLAYGLHSQMSSPYFRAFGQVEPTRSHQLSLGYEWRMKPDLVFRSEAFYHRLFNAPVVDTDTGQGRFTPLNELTAWSWIPGNVLDGTAEGENYGLEFSFEQFLTDGYYYMMNATLYRSTYRLPESDDFQSGRYDGRYIANITAGKEWLKAKSDDKTRIWGLNLRINYAGGLREAPIDVQASERTNYTVYDFEQGYTEQLADFSRTDLRIYLKKSRPKYSSTLALDIQNLFNQQNVAYNYYDIFTQGLDQRYQISLVPILTYRVEF
jgi:hypothetical protein